MTAYIFDIDGVLTNPYEKDEMNPQFVPLLVTKLQEGHPIGLISGRPLSWEISTVVEKLEQYVAEHTEFAPTVLDNLFVSGEFGSTAAIHEEGKRQEIVYKERSVPKDLREKLQHVVVPFQEHATTDEKKLTMFTVFANEKSTLTAFKEQAKHIVPVIRPIVGEYPMFEIHEDRMAINVRHQLATKHTATAQFLQWLSEKKVIPTHVYAFGDSPSDLEMGEELYRRNMLFTFIYVGDKEGIGHNPAHFPIIFTDKHYAEGTLDYLNKIDR